MSYIEWSAPLKPLNQDHDNWSLIRGRDVDITLAHSELSTLEDADVFLVNEGATGNLSDTKYITASNMKTYFQSGLSSVTVDDALSDSSANPVENHVVYDGLATKLNLSGGTMTGHLDMGDYRLTNMQRLSFNDGSGYIIEFIDDDDMVGTGISGNKKISSSSSIKAYVDNTFKHIKTSGFNYSSSAGTKVYIPLGATTGESFALSGGNEWRHMVAPFDGYLDQVIFRSEEACGSTIVGLHKSGSGTEVPNSTASATVTVDMAYDDIAYKFDFTTNNTFSAGDIIAISFDPTNDANDTNATIIFRYDGTQGV